MSFSEWIISCTDGYLIISISNTTYINVDLAHYNLFHAEGRNVGIKAFGWAKNFNSHKIVCVCEYKSA